MCKSRTKIKQMPFPSFRKGLDRKYENIPEVKFNFKWDLFSWILLHKAAFCPKWAFFVQFSFLQKSFMEIAFFGKKMLHRAKFKKRDPT